MAKRAFSMLLTDPSDRARVEAFIARFLAEHHRQQAEATAIQKEMGEIIDAMRAKHNVPKELEMYIDTTLHADHGLLIFASMQHREEDPVASIKERRLN